jgi:hypothetical protein
MRHGCKAASGRAFRSAISIAIQTKVDGQSICFQTGSSIPCQHTKLPMPSSRFGQPFSWIPFDVTALSSASKFLMVYGALMWLACGLT